MFNKIYETIKKILKENIILIAFLILFYIMINIEFPYYIEAPGSVINTSERVSVDNAYKASGELYMASVSQIRGIIPTLLISLINKEMDIVKKEEVVYNNETYEESNIRAHLYLNNSINNATKVAFTKAGKKYNITSSKIYAIYIDELANTDIKIGDELIKINGYSIYSVMDIKNIVSDSNENDILNILVKREGKEINTTANVFLYDDNKYIGVSAIINETIETNPNINWSFEKTESGPSGGLMLSLAIYNSLTEKDITKGKKIVGTGTIDNDGNVGEIGGVKYKLAAAVKSHADVFLVPNGNYDEAIMAADNNNYSIKIESVGTFDEALYKLKEI